MNVDQLKYELPWSGIPFRDAPFLAFDTETAVYDPSGREYDLTREIPPLVLATVSDGTRHAVLWPEQLPDFTYLHKDKLLVGHNIAFDYWVVLQQLMKSTGSAAHHWWRQPDLNLMDDTMLLDFLVRLGTTGGMVEAGYRNLGELAALVGMEADKESPYRLRFHELIGRDWKTVDRGFFDYAIQDTAVTWPVYKHLFERASVIAAGVELDRNLSDDRLSVFHRYGPLTSKLQTRAAIVLAQVGRNGMKIDTEKLAAVRTRLVDEIRSLVLELDRYDPPIFQKYVEKKRAGQFKLNPDTGIPKISQDTVRIHLSRIADEMGINREFLPKTPKGDKLGTSLDPWRSLAGDHPLIRSWGRLMDLAKVLQFVVQLAGKESVHPSFYPLVRTGRTSCRNPNIQQMPRETWFRELFVPQPGHSFVIVDYSAIEIVTLAAVLLNRYGKSVMADVLRSGRKPHDYTAALVTGWPYEEVVEGVKAEKKAVKAAKAAGLPPPPTPYSDARQSAKAINFGVPGGLGARKMTVYAKSNYGVDMDEEQARELRGRLIHQIYPELSDYLEDDPYEAIAANLGCDVADLDQLFNTSTKDERRLMGRLIDNVVARGGRAKAGHHYPVGFRDQVWDGLQALNRNPALTKVLQERDSTMEARLGLTGQTVTTLTGRVRAGADYGEARNTPFQGLAADGAKVALWRLFMAGYRIVNYVHDEIVVEVPDDQAEAALKEVSRIMVESMSEVLLCDVPVEVEGVIAKAWVK